MVVNEIINYYYLKRIKKFVSIIVEGFERNDDY